MDNEYRIITRRIAVTITSTAAIAAFGLGVATPQAGAYPGQECTYDQPYPNSPYKTCTGFGQSCSRSLCSSAPGTEGKMDINGRYTPCMGSCSNPYD